MQLNCKTVLLQAVELQRDPSREEIESEMQWQKARKKQPVGCSNVSHISAGASQAEMPSPSLAMEVKFLKRDFYTRMSAMEAHVKAIMQHLNVPVPVDTNICNVQPQSSIPQKHSTPNMDFSGLQQSTSECLLKSVLTLYRCSEFELVNLTCSLLQPSTLTTCRCLHFAGSNPESGLFKIRRRLERRFSQKWHSPCRSCTHTWCGEGDM